MANDDKRFIWWRDLPLWVSILFSLLGLVISGLLVYIAFHSFSPLVENLEIRDRNMELSEVNSRLEKSISDHELKKRLLDVDYEILSRKIKGAEERVTELKEQAKEARIRQDKVIDTLALTTTNINQALEREREISQENKNLRDENKKSVSKGRELETRINSLQDQVVKSKREFTFYKVEMIRIQRELQESYRLNRVYILDQFVKKIRNIAGSKFSTLKRWEMIPSGGIHYEFKYARYKTINTLFGSLINDQYFDLLPGSRKEKLQKDIQQYLLGRSDIFSEEFVANEEIQKRYFDMINSLSKTRQKRKRDNSSVWGAALFLFTASRFLMTDEDFNSLLEYADNSEKQKFTDIRTAWFNEVKRVNSIRKSIYSALDQMKKELSS